MEKIKLFAFPFAGGSAHAYDRWKPFLRPDLVLRPVELAGRGKRMQDAYYDHMDEVIADVYGIIRHELEGPYALYGHSMGALIVYELAQKIIREQHKAPLHLFFSGTRAPHMSREDDRTFHLMDDDTFKEEVLGLGGTPPEIFEEPALMHLFMPLLKNDFKIVETYPFEKEIHPFEQDITVFLGLEDDQTQEERDGWHQHTTRHCDIQYFEGGHFFINDRAQMLRFIHLINKKIKYRKLSSAF